MMKMDADVVAMTMPDINNYHIKRSYVRKDIKYVYLPHGIDSINLTMRKGSVDHYDSILVTGKYQREEVEKTGEVYNLKEREIVNMGYPLLDDMIRAYEKTEHKTHKKKTIMIAPSWQKDNIIDLCLDDVLNSLKGRNYKVIVRPHPQHVRHMRDMFEKMKEEYKGTNIEIQTDFSKTNPILEADLLITDWSSIGYEYAFTTEKPVISIDTPMKIMNPEYEKIGVEPFNIWARNEIGEVISVKNAKNIDKLVEKILKHQDEYREKIAKLKQDSMYNIKKSAKVGAKYIIKCVQEQIRRRKEND
jgi:YidC/Oxa1 family membrane protein insertase